MIDQSSRARLGFRLPRKGSRARTMLLLLLRPQGLSLFEAKRRGLARWNQDFRTTICRLEYETGFDIRITGRVRANQAWGDVYRIAGRHRWSGPYRATAPELADCPNARS